MQYSNKKENVSLILSVIIAFMHYFTFKDTPFLVIFSTCVFLMYITYIENSKRLKVSLFLSVILFIAYEKIFINSSNINNYQAMTLLSLDFVFILLVVLPVLFFQNEMYSKFKVNNLFFHTNFGAEKYKIRLSELQPMPESYFPDFSKVGVVSLNPKDKGRELILDKEDYHPDSSHEYFIFRKK